MVLGYQIIHRTHIHPQTFSTGFETIQYIVEVIFIPAACLSTFSHSVLDVGKAVVTRSEGSTHEGLWGVCIVTMMRSFPLTPKYIKTNKHQMIFRESTRHCPGCLGVQASDTIQRLEMRATIKTTLG